jgi:hypothetical protein
MLTVLQQFPAWLSVLVAAVGAVVSGLSLGRSRWSLFLLAGFLAEAIAMAFSQVALMGIRAGVVGASSLGLAFLATSLLGLAGRGSVVAGVAGVLSELRRASGGAGTQSAI